MRFCLILKVATFTWRLILSTTHPPTALYLSTAYSLDNDTACDFIPWQLALTHGIHFTAIEFFQ